MADVFEELLALVTPERLLHHPQATGEGVRVCILDTGVEHSLLLERCQARGQPLLPIEGGVFQGQEKMPRPWDGHQSAPHGTTVADIILSIAPRIQLFSADVFGPQGTCELDVILNALHWAVHVWDCRIINLSLGVADYKLPQLQRRHQLQRAIEDCYFHDVLVVAAAHNDHPLTLSYPAIFAPPLVSVDKQLFSHPWHFAYAPHQQIEFQAHGRGEFGPFANEPATSWAAPHLTGVAARLLSLRPQLKPFEVKTLLYWLSKGMPAG